MKYQLLLQLLVELSEELSDGGVAIIRTREGWKVALTPLETCGDSKKVIDRTQAQDTCILAIADAINLSEYHFIDDEGKPSREV